MTFEFERESDSCNGSNEVLAAAIPAPDFGSSPNVLTACGSFLGAFGESLGAIRANFHDEVDYVCIDVFPAGTAVLEALDSRGRVMARRFSPDGPGASRTVWIEHEGIRAVRFTASQGAVLFDNFSFRAKAKVGRFVRGDANGDLGVDISDGLAILGFLFGGATGQGRISCLDTADVDDSGDISISDPIVLLNYQFLGRGKIPGPFPQCGEDASDDGFDCGSSSSACE